MCRKELWMMVYTEGMVGLQIAREARALGCNPDVLVKLARVKRPLTQKWCRTGMKRH